MRPLAIACAIVLGGLAAAHAAEPSIAVHRLPPPGEAKPAPTPTSFPQATAVRVGGDHAKTRFVMDFDRKVDVATFTLADPYRIVVDLPQVAFKLPPHAGDQGRGLIKAFRYGLIMEGGSRIVLDVTRPVRVDKAFTLAPADGQLARLVLDLSATDRASYLHNIKVSADSLPHHEAHVQSDVSTGDNDPRPLVVIDPGHGGIDSGTKGLGGEDEKDIVLAFGLKLREALLAGGKYRVAMTRSDDTFIPLQQRVQFARKRKASLFISIHADSLPRSEGVGEGASVYTLSEHASDAEAAKLAEKENKSDIIAGVDLRAQPDDVASILIDLAQRETKTFSVRFARTLVGGIKPVAPLHLKPVKAAGFVVLKAPDVPSVLVELGYMSTERDLKNLISADWRAHTAQAMAQAVDDFFARRTVGTSVGTR